MTVTLGAWLGASMAMAVAAFIATCIGALLVVLAWWTAVELGWAQWVAAPWAPTAFFAAYALIRLGLYVLATALIVSEARLRFDRIAGRLAGGAVAVAVDELLHGRPLAPERLEDDGRARGPLKSARDDEAIEVAEDLGPR
jgi:hypothetical protein